MIMRTPQARAAISADSPTAPAPNTTSDASSPGFEDVEDRSRSGLDAASQRRRDGEIDLVSMTTTFDSYAIACEAKLDCPKYEPYTAEPLRRIVVEPSTRVPIPLSDRKLRQYGR